MKYYSIRKYACVPFLILAVLLVSRAVPAADEITWKPVSAAELQMNTPVVEAGADAEALFWDVTVDDKFGHLNYRHYVRVKIFTERGRERFAKMDIPFMKGKKVEDIAARVIKPDGTIVNLKPSDIFEREIVRSSWLKVMAKSFAVPGIEPGVIVEYQYSETMKYEWAGVERLSFQRDIPMQKVIYHIRPRAGKKINVRLYNMAAITFVKDPGNEGFLVTTVTNLPALRLEPNMPPEDEVRQWAYLSYPNEDSNEGWDYFPAVYRPLLDNFARDTKDLRKKSAELTAGAATSEEKLRRIYRFVQTGIRNLSFDRSLSDKQGDVATIRDAVDVLEKEEGHAIEIDLLFAALAKAAGFETGIFLAADRTNHFFTPKKYPHPGFLQPGGIAVLIYNSWKYFEPGIPYLPYGQILWNNEGAPALVVEAKEYGWKSVPLLDEAQSPVRRTGKFKLLADGFLEGKVTLEYEGHQAAQRRRDGFMSSAAKREENVVEEAKENIRNGEITAVSIENFDDSSKPLVYRFDVRVPSYAQKTGKRLFLQPGFFEYGSAAAFSAAERVHPIYFPYAWSEADDVEIELPKGYRLDNADAPGDVSDPAKAGSLKIAIAFDEASGVLKYRRNFHFGANGKLIFPISYYRDIRRSFGEFHQADTHIVTLKQDQ
jgi:hypothetical protein